MFTLTRTAQVLPIVALLVASLLPATASAETYSDTKWGNTKWADSAQVNVTADQADVVLTADL